MQVDVINSANRATGLCLPRCYPPWPSLWSSPDCDDGWEPGTPVGCVCKSFDRRQLEHSNAPMSDTLQHPKLQYMPQSTGDYVLPFQILLAWFLTSEKKPCFLLSWSEKFCVYLRNQIFTRKRLLSAFISVRSLHQFFNLQRGVFPELGYWFSAFASWKIFPAYKQWDYLHFLKQLKYIVSHSSVWKDRERLKEWGKNKRKSF